MKWNRARNLVQRRQAFAGWRRVTLAGVGGAIVIALLAAGGDIMGVTLLAASFGASCVLVFTVPDAPLSQPANVVAGHLMTTFCGLLVGSIFPSAWWSIALAVGLAIAAMAAFQVTHPPAGANPTVVLTTGASWSYLVSPILVGAMAVVVIGLVFHRVTGTAYPARPVAAVTPTANARGRM